MWSETISLASVFDLMSYMRCSMTISMVSQIINQKFVLIATQQKWNFSTIFNYYDINNYLQYCLFVCLMVFNATFNNISGILWRSILLVKETVGPGENHWPVASHWQTLSHNVCTPRPDRDSNSQHQWWALIA